MIFQKLDVSTKSDAYVFIFLRKLLCKFKSAIIAKCVLFFSSEKTRNVYIIVPYQYI